jgi:hypothetical protein
MCPKKGKQIQEKAGRQFQDDMTPSRAATIRSQRIAGNQISNQAKGTPKRPKKKPGLAGGPLTDHGRKTR